MQLTDNLLHKYRFKNAYMDSNHIMVLYAM